jgi:hypothetical protein
MRRGLPREAWLVWGAWGSPLPGSGYLSFLPPLPFFFVLPTYSTPSPAPVGLLRWLNASPARA